MTKKTSKELADELCNALDEKRILEPDQLTVEAAAVRLVAQDARIAELTKVAEPMDLGLARAMCRSAGISLVSRDFIERFADFVMDWKKGDFTLPKYAELDMQSCFDAWQAFDPDLAADTRWIPVGERLPEKGRVPVLVAVSFIKHAEHEDGTQYVIEGVDVTEGEYVPKHGESDGYMESYQGRHGDASHVTHWMPLPNPPIDAAVNAFNGVKP